MHRLGSILEDTSAHTHTQAPTMREIDTRLGLLIESNPTLGHEHTLTKTERTDSFDSNGDFGCWKKGPMEDDVCVW